MVEKTETLLPFDTCLLVFSVLRAPPPQTPDLLRGPITTYMMGLHSRAIKVEQWSGKAAFLLTSALPMRASMCVVERVRGGRKMDKALVPCPRGFWGLPFAGANKRFHGYLPHSTPERPEC
ncbi:hypothetical protein SKAU_G00029590 [Synaphobranchus kaupii]|uniref:Uncharacterized protein n=1 Tax=Synaphobranchus kaupii TaxID=118154 RepID=A0A9Q1JD10_SYNKA|nr:hypothetical protein SKAU_G00029590 [Synaphobranchus kaupii]